MSLAPGSARAQRVDLGSTVLCGPSKETAQPAPGVAVRIENSDAKPVTTGQNGYFRFT